MDKFSHQHRAIFAVYLTPGHRKRDIIVVLGRKVKLSAQNRSSIYIDNYLQNNQIEHN